MDHTLNIAERLSLDLLCLYIDPTPRWSTRNVPRQRFADETRSNASRFSAKAIERDVHADAIFAAGRVLETVDAIVARNRRIEFVVAEPGIGIRELRATLSVPVFAAVIDRSAQTRQPTHASNALFARQDGILSAGFKFLTGTSRKGGKKMGSSLTKRKTIQKAFVFGAAAAALYAAVFVFSDPLMAFATKGGFFAIVPVATVFLFSYVHGNFTNYFWSALGIEASKSVGVQPTVKAAKPAKRKDTRPRARLNV